MARRVRSRVPRLPGPALVRACPRRGCYRVVDRLSAVEISVGLLDRGLEWVCDECLREYQDRAAADRAVVVRVIDGRELR